MTTRFLPTLFCFVLVFFLINAAQAQSRGFGLGLILGEPTGLSAKAWLDDQSALDFAAAWSLEGRNSFHLHANYLRHAFVIDVNKGSLPLYYGIGARLLLLEGRDRFDDDDDVRFGLRIPLGITYLFDGAPLDVFLELAPVVELLPSTDVDLEGGVGIRYYF